MVQDNQQIHEQLEETNKLGVTTRSHAGFYSQAHMVKKKQGKKKRFTIDFRSLNEATTSHNRWPIPNIERMLDRIMQHKPKRFAVLDLTSGYHQLAIHEECRKYTAFATFNGIYEWTRVPMGLKGAGSYFQMMMATEVLNGLVGEICEIYIDDIIIYADDETQLLDRLEIILQRLEEFNIKLNPTKADIGASEIEYVGRILDEHGGVRMSDERKEQLFAFQLPETHQLLKRFIGMAGFFRPHIKNFHDYEAPLRKLFADNYKKTAKILWTADAEKVFLDLKTALNNAQTIYHIDESLTEWELVLQTDASNTGCGGVLLQRKYNAQTGEIDEERPVKLFSRSFHGAELNWATNEQEAFGIFFACKTWKHLLMGRQFTIETDHKNLLYINDTASPKVIRWKMAMMDLDFILRHIAGAKNVIADDCSRMCIMQCMSTLSKEARDPSAEWDRANALNTMLHGLRQLQDHEAYCPACSPTPDGDSKDRFAGNGLINQQIGVMSQTFHPVWASELDITKFLSRAGRVTTLAPVLTRGHKHARSNPPDDGVDSDAGRGKVKLQRPARVGELPSELEPVPPSQVPRAQVKRVRFAEDIMVRDADTHFDLDSKSTLLSQADLQIDPVVNSLFKEAHNCYRGHHGQLRSTQIIKDRVRDRTSNVPATQVNGYRLPFNYDAMIRKLIRTCPVCQKMAHIKHPIETHSFTVSSYTPWTRIQVDTLGPFPPDEKGYEYIVVIIDCFSRFCLLYPARTATSEEATECLLHMTSIFPTPEVIYSDNGPQFVATVVEELISAMGMLHKTITPGSHEENSIVERANKEVLRHLQAFCAELHAQGQWSRAIPFMNRIMNAQVHSTTGVAPYQVIFGLLTQLDPTLIRPFNREDVFFNDKTFSDFLQKHLVLQEKVIEIARTNIMKHDIYHTQKKIDKVTTVFPIGSYVITRYGRPGEMSSKPPNKLHTNWDGPKQVLAVDVDGTEYTLRNIVKGTTETHHVTNLKTFSYEKDTFDPLKIAVRGTEDRFIVEKILQARVARSKVGKILRNDTTFLTKWAGYSEPDWQPYKNLRQVIKLHEFLRSHSDKDMQDLIPPEFR